MQGKNVWSFLLNLSRCTAVNNGATDQVKVYYLQPDVIIIGEQAVTYLSGPPTSFSRPIIALFQQVRNLAV